MNRYTWWLLKVKIAAPFHMIKRRLQQCWWEIDRQLPNQCFLCRKWKVGKNMRYETTLSYGHYKPICPACHKQHFESLP